MMSAAIRVLARAAAIQMEEAALAAGPSTLIKGKAKAADPASASASPSASASHSKQPPPYSACEGREGRPDVGLEMNGEPRLWKPPIMPDQVRNPRTIMPSVSGPRHPLPTGGGEKQPDDQKYHPKTRSIPSIEPPPGHSEPEPAVDPSQGFPSRNAASLVPPEARQPSPNSVPSPHWSAIDNQSTSDPSTSPRPPGSEPGDAIPPDRSVNAADPIAPGTSTISGSPGIGIDEFQEDEDVSSVRGTRPSLITLGACPPEILESPILPYRSALPLWL